MRTTAFALLLALCASGHAVAQKSVAKVSKAVAARASGQPSGTGHGGSHHHHHHGSFVGFGVGFAYPWGWWYPPYPYYVPVGYSEPTVTWVEQDAPPVTIEPAWWYYCETSRGYYPNAKECPDGWQRVPASPQ